MLQLPDSDINDRVHTWHSQRQWFGNDRRCLSPLRYVEREKKLKTRLVINVPAIYIVAVYTMIACFVSINVLFSNLSDSKTATYRWVSAGIFWNERLSIDLRSMDVIFSDLMFRKIQYTEHVKAAWHYRHWRVTVIESCRYLR